MKSALMIAAAMAMLGAAAPHTITPLRTIAERRKKAERAAIKTGRAPVPIADTDILDAAEAKRERKAAKAARDIARSKQVKP